MSSKSFNEKINRFPDRCRNIWFSTNRSFSPRILYMSDFGKTYQQVKNTKGMCHLTIIVDNEAYIHRFSSILIRTDFDKVYMQLKNTIGICHFKIFQT